MVFASQSGIHFARNHPRATKVEHLYGHHTFYEKPHGAEKTPRHGFVESRPQISHLGISWDAYDRITNPGCKIVLNGRVRGGVFLLSLPYGNSTLCEPEHRHFEEVNHRISLWFNSLLLKIIIYNRQIIMNHRIKWQFSSIFHNYVIDVQRVILISLRNQIVFIVMGVIRISKWWFKMKHQTFGLFPHTYRECWSIELGSSTMATWRPLFGTEMGIQ